jgi:hypothetical protein
MLLHRRKIEARCWVTLRSPVLRAVGWVSGDGPALGGAYVATCGYRRQATRRRRDRSRHDRRDRHIAGSTSWRHFAIVERASLERDSQPQRQHHGHAAARARERGAHRALSPAKLWSLTLFLTTAVVEWLRLPEAAITAFRISV